MIAINDKSILINGVYNHPQVLPVNGRNQLMEPTFRPEIENGKTQEKHWENWRWQLRNCIHSVKDLTELLNLSDGFLEKTMDKYIDPYFYMKVTPHFAVHLKNIKEQLGVEQIIPLLRTMLPAAIEFENSFETIDGMGEDSTGEHKLISTLYKERALLFVTNRCPVHCRYCFRRRKINDEENIVSKSELFKAIDKIGQNPEIKDVILSGGDPLTVSEDTLNEILEKLNRIPHVEIVRIDTKFATVLPQRFTSSLIEILRKRTPLYMTLHFAHPLEISPATVDACNNLADNGIVLGSYIPLLKGINDDRKTLKELFRKLVKMRVRPYYLVQNVTNKWNRQFQVPIEKGLEIMDGLHGEISGLALPTYIVYLPDAGGKVPLQRNYIKNRVQNGWYIENFQGRKIFYWDPKNES
jgi:lysine 2,3-aminomutase